MRLALLGPPGSGKGTQAAKICEIFNLAHLSSGDILRSEKNSGSPHGEKIRGFIDSGALVPDDLMIDVMKNRIAAIGNRGFVLDGFPRTIPQAHALGRMLLDLDRPLMLVLNFIVDLDKIATRFEGRRICPQCGAVYHVLSNPPAYMGRCDNDDADLIIREDDKPEVIRRRFDTYQKTTSPLIAYYTQLGNFKTIFATGPIEEVTAKIVQKIKRHFADD